jgi:type I restriction enzyme, R subunit
MTTGAENYVPRYPSPEELWNLVFAEENIWRDRFAEIPFEESRRRERGALLSA